jgi:hypothetical protein
MTTAVELLRQGRRDEFWQRHCGFFDLTTEEFTAIQERLLTEQLHLLADSMLGRKVVGKDIPLNPDEFRRVAPLTTYKDYLPYLVEQREDVLPAKPVCWVRTSGSTDEYPCKWVPVSATYHSQIAKAIVTLLTLAGAKFKGDIRIEEGDTLFYTAAPPPYLTGTGMRVFHTEFPFRAVPPVDEAEKMTFQERVQQGFLRSMGSGIDYFVGVASVLLRMGEAFTSGARQLSLSPRLLRPATVYQLTKAFLTSKLNGRDVLPKDIWRPKGIVASGMDVQVYKQRIKALWGRDPLEAYACTEFGSIAYQAWGEKRRGLTFVPDSAFWEFLPVADYRLWRQNPSYNPKTLLLDEVQPGEYVPVATSLGGGAFIRYVLTDLIKVISLADDEMGIKLPQIQVESRADNVINLGSMVVLSERALWQAIGQLDLGTVNWSARKEYGSDHREPTIRLYIEGANIKPEALATQIHEALIETHEDYASFNVIMGTNPIRITPLAPGTYEGYLLEKEAEAADLGQLKPPRMQPSDQVLKRLLAISAGLDGRRLG